MKKLSFAIVVATAAIWLTGTTSCSHIRLLANCDTTVNSWKHFIRRDSAQVLINRFTALDPTGNVSNTWLSQSHLYDSAKGMMRNMMLRDSCAGMRIYYGLTWANKIIPIVCGTTRTGSDIYWLRRDSTKMGRGTPPEYIEGLCDMSQGEPPTPTNGARLMLGPQ